MREKTVVNEVQLEAVLAPMTPSQRNAFQMFLEGKDIFLFGAGGTGKSVNLMRICQECPHLECHAHGEAIPRNKETA